MSRLLAGLKRYRWWLLGIGGPIVLVGAILIALPYVVRGELAAWLRQDGVREASVERVAIHYLDSQIEIFGIRSTDKDGKALRFDRISLAVDLPALFDRRVHVRALAFEGGAIEVTQSREGAVSLAGIPMAEPDPASPPSDSRPWLIGIDATQIGSLAIRLHVPDGTQDFKVENAQLGTFAMWAGEATTALQLAAAIGEGSLAVSGEAVPLGASPSAAIDLEVKSFDLAQLRFLHGMEELKGVFAGRLNIRADVGREGAATVRLVGDAKLSGLELPAAGPSIGELSWTGEANVATQGDGSLTARVNGRLALEKLAVEKNTIGTATIENLDLTFRQNPNNAMDADIAGSFDVAKASFDLGDSQGGAGRLRWNGKLRFANSPAEGDRIEAKGDLIVDAPRYAAPGTDVSLSRLSYDGLDAKVTLAPNDALSVQSAGALTANEAKAKLGEDSIGNGSLSWKGTVSVAMEPGRDPEVALDGVLDSKATEAQMKSLGYAASQREAHWQGTAKLGADGAMTMAGTARTVGTTVDAPAQKLRLLDVGQLSLDEATLADNGRIAAKAVQIDTLRAFGPPGAKDNSGFVAAVRALTADELGFEPGERIFAKRVKIDDAEVELERDDKGRLRLTGILAALRGDREDEPAPSGDRKPPRIEVGELTLGGKSRVQFTDRSVDPPAKVGFAPIALRLGALDSAAPTRPVPVEFEANIGRYAELNLTGSAKPFTERLNLDLQGKLSGFELTSLSGYLSQFLGYDLSRGRLDTSLQIRIVDGMLDSGSQLTVTNLVLEQGRSDASRALQQNLEIPVETALSLLRNSDDVIELNVPVTGDINNPNFDISDAINTAIGNAMKRTVMTLIFPLGGLIAIAESGDAGLQFKPIAFAGGEVDLDANAKQNLDAIAKLLAERRGVRITACGVSTQRDADDILRVRRQKAMIEAEKTSQPPEPIAPVTRDELYDLSQRRSEAVKDYIIGRPGVTEERVFTCAPNISDDANAQPHANITL